MRILHVVRGMSNSSGTTHIVHALANHQAKLGNEVRILSVERYGENACLPEEPRVHVEVLRGTWKSLQRWRMLKNLGYSLPFRTRMLECVNESDVVHIHAIWNYPTYCAMRVASRAGVPYVVSPQGSLESWALGQSQWAKTLYGRWWEQPLYDKATAMVVLTDAEAEQCRRFGIKSPTMLLPNGVDHQPQLNDDAKRKLKDKWKAPSGVPIFLFLSRLHPKKGVDVLIRAISEIRVQSSCQFWIAGHDAHGNLAESLLQLARELDLEQKVKFLGEVQGADKFELLQLADVFLLPSHSEGMPMAALEALSCGTPVLVTAGCNLPEVALQQAGWITNPNVVDLRNSLEEILRSPEEWDRRGDNARKLAEDNFQWQSIASRSLMIYHEAIRASA